MNRCIIQNPFLCCWSNGLKKMWECTQICIASSCNLCKSGSTAFSQNLSIKRLWSNRTLFKVSCWTIKSHTFPVFTVTINLYSHIHTLYSQYKSQLIICLYVCRSGVEISQNINFISECLTLRRKNELGSHTWRLVTYGISARYMHGLVVLAVLLRPRPSEGVCVRASAVFALADAWSPVFCGAMWNRVMNWFSGEWFHWSLDLFLSAVKPNKNTSRCIESVKQIIFIIKN